MRILFTTRGSSGHLRPLAPIAHAAIDAGHEVLVTAQRQHRSNVEREGLPFAPVGDPPQEEWMPLLGSFGELGPDAADEVMVGQFFAGIDTRAALPELLDVVASWKPDAIVRETWEFASTIAAEEHEVPIARVGLGLATMEARTIRLAAPALGEIRARRGLDPDEDATRLATTPYLSLTPQPLDGPTAPPSLIRFREESRPTAAALPDWWPGDRNPLVYVSFGTVTPEPHLPFFPALYRAAIEAVADLPVRVLATVGEGRDAGELGVLPSNVRVERWVPQEEVVSAASVVVSHGGYSTTLGALSQGVPMVVLPLFSADQWDNAAAVARAGAGVSLDDERETRRVFDLPAAETLGRIGPSVSQVLAESSYRDAAEHVAAAIASLPPAGAVIDAIAGAASP